jgi:hypothetical protein
MHSTMPRNMDATELFQAEISSSETAMLQETRFSTWKKNDKDA